MADISFILKNVLKNYCLSQRDYYRDQQKERNAQKIDFSEIKNTNFNYN